MAMKHFLLIGLGVAAIVNQAAGYHVKKQATDLRTLVQQVSEDRRKLERMQTEELFRRRHLEVERWAEATEGLVPVKPSQMRTSIAHAVLPKPKPRPKLVPQTPQGDDNQTLEALLASLQAERAL